MISIMLGRGVDQRRGFLARMWRTVVERMKSYPYSFARAMFLAIIECFDLWVAL